MLAVPAVWQAVGHVREVLPILQLEPSTVRKLDARLGKLARRLAKFQGIDAQLTLVASLPDLDRQLRQAITRVTNDLHRRRTKAGGDAAQNKVAVEFRRPARKLELTLKNLGGNADSSAILRATRWAIKARAARRAVTLRQAIDDAGSVYVPGRLRDVRAAVRKLVFGTELLSEIAGAPGHAEIQTLEQARENLDALRDLEMLIVRVRRIQEALTPRDARAREELDALVRLLENRSRRLHAGYVRERSALVALCGRAGARSAPGAARQKVS